MAFNMLVLVQITHASSNNFPPFPAGVHPLPSASPSACAPLPLGSSSATKGAAAELS